MNIYHHRRKRIDQAQGVSAAGDGSAGRNTYIGYSGRQFNYKSLRACNFFDRSGYLFDLGGVCPEGDTAFFDVGTTDIQFKARYYRFCLAIAITPFL